MSDFYIKENKISVDNSSFNAVSTLFSGQVFRVKQIEENSYFLVANDLPAIIEIHEEQTDIITSNVEHFVNYFSLEDNIKLKTDDPFAIEAISNTQGLKIMKQDKFETIIDFIMSANNNIKRFSKTLFGIAKKYGKCKTFEGHTFHTFPTAKTLATADISDFKMLGMGYRDTYVKRTSQMIADSYDLNAPLQLPTMQANKKLRELVGIGEKVADCILLFAYQKYDAFPVDTWIKKLYYENYDQTERNPQQIRQYFVDKFGCYAGIIQQHLFHYKRT